MQRLIAFRFFCFPAFQKKCVLYTNINATKTRLFSSLILQVSAKNSLLFRTRNSFFGHLLSRLFFFKKFKIKFKREKNIQVGYFNNNKVILFGFNEENLPITVYKELEQNTWEESPFLGYTLIEEYSKKEYFFKRDYIKKALSIKWESSYKGKPLHGDLTHFNILLNSENKIFFIDENGAKNSNLYDHFYFYSYYIQCLEKCKTISNKDVLIIKKDLQSIIKEVCVFNTKEELKNCLNTIDFKQAAGLNSKDRGNNLLAFSNFMLES